MSELDKSKIDSLICECKLNETFLPIYIAFVGSFQTRFEILRVLPIPRIKNGSRFRQGTQVHTQNVKEYQKPFQNIFTL